MAARSSALIHESLSNSLVLLRFVFGDYKKFFDLKLNELYKTKSRLEKFVTQYSASEKKTLVKTKKKFFILISI